MSTRLRRLLPSLLVGFAVPGAVYFLVRPHVAGDTIALAIGGAIPVVWTLATFAWRRRVDPLGAVAVAVFGLAILATMLTGGGSLALKVHDAALTGAGGIACLVSVAVRRPLLAVLLRLIGREPAGASRAAMMVATGIVGVTLVTHAVVHVILALTLPTAAYVVTSRVAGWAIVAAGLLALLMAGRLRGRVASP